MSSIYNTQICLVSLAKFQENSLALLEKYKKENPETLLIFSIKPLESHTLFGDIKRFFFEAEMDKDRNVFEYINGGDDVYVFDGISFKKYILETDLYSGRPIFVLEDKYAN